MFQKFFPSLCQESVYSIDFEKFYKKGYRGVIFDVDNTLVPHGAPADKRAIDLMRNLSEMGFKTCLLSNNGRTRVSSFSDKTINEHYIYRANKPSRRNYVKAMKLLETRPKNTLFIGDQIFTDIYGANRAGIYSILVKPMHPKEEIQIVIKRCPEKLVMHFYKKEQNRKKAEK